MLKINPKPFYFVRHGQTDYNLITSLDKGDHTEEIPLNETGKAQARSIEPTISSLQVEMVISSPMKRVQETKDIISPRLQAPHHNVVDLSECTMKVWQELRQLTLGSPYPEEGALYDFLERVQNGIKEALSFPGTPLIVAHGGIHWALCFLMQIEQYEWAVHNCGIVRFSVQEKGKWKAERL